MKCGVLFKMHFYFSSLNASSTLTPIFKGVRKYCNTVFDLKIIRMKADVLDRDMVLGFRLTPQLTFCFLAKRPGGWCKRHCNAIHEARPSRHCVLLANAADISHHWEARFLNKTQLVSAVEVKKEPYTFYCKHMNSILNKKALLQKIHHLCWLLSQGKDLKLVLMFFPPPTACCLAPVYFL